MLDFQLVELLVVKELSAPRGLGGSGDLEVSKAHTISRALAVFLPTARDVSFELSAAPAAVILSQDGL